MRERNSKRRRGPLTNGREWRFARSLRLNTVLLLAFAMLPAGVLACLQALSNYRQLSTLAEDTMVQAAVLSTQEEENVVVNARRVLQLLAVLPEVTEPLAGGCEATLAAVRATSESYGPLAVTNERGDVVCSSPPLSAPVNVAEQPWFRSVMGRGVFTVTAGGGGASGDAIMVASLPLTDGEGKTTGALFLAIGTRWLKELLVETEISEVTHVALVDNAGNVIASDSARAAASRWLPDKGFLRANVGGGPKTLRIMEDGASVIAVAPLLPNNLYVVVGGAPGASAAGSGWRLAGAIGFPLVMWLIALAVAWFALDRLAVRPILRLERTAAAFAAGKQSVRASGLDDMPQEIAQLGQTLNFMADTLASRETELQRAVDEQKTLLKELHHRVKNNLQVITSLLNLQINRARGDGERRALRATQDRIYALARVHDSLSRVSGASVIQLDETISQIIDHLTRATGARGKPVRVHLDLDYVETQSKSAVPIALLVTEAISSALDAPDGGGAPDHLWVSLKCADDRTLMLTVESDGQSAKTAAADGDNLSAKLAAGFVKQLGGQSTLETEKGYRLRVTIPHHC